MWFVTYKYDLWLILFDCDLWIFICDQCKITCHLVHVTCNPPLLLTLSTSTQHLTCTLWAYDLHQHHKHHYLKNHHHKTISKSPQITSKTTTKCLKNYHKNYQKSRQKSRKSPQKLPKTTTQTVLNHLKITAMAIWTPIEKFGKVKSQKLISTSCF